MKNDTPPNLVRQYQTDLARYLKEGPGGDLESARELGRQAIALEVDTLDLARIHEVALVALSREQQRPNESEEPTVVLSQSVLGLAGIFFAEALTPIELTHRGALEASAELAQIIKTLSQRTLELSASNRDLQEEIRLRKGVEDSLLNSQRAADLLLEKSSSMQEELRQLSRQLLSVQEEERRRISRELHDVIGQTLTIINVQLAALNAKTNTNTEEFQQVISKTQFAVETAVQRMHRFAMELRPSMLDDLGLIPALQAYLRSFLQETGIRTSLSTFAQIEECNTEQRTVFYRIAQETLTNVRKHAKATRADITITRQASGYTMTVTDDGIGFAFAVKGFVDGHNRLGLLGMRERIAMVGGTFHIESAPNAGTTVTAFIPISSETQSFSAN
jgi:signal transduction histidine kinase